MKTALLLVAILALTTKPAIGQFLDPERAWTCVTCYSHASHAVVSGGVDLALRIAPFIKPSWQTPVGRVVMVAIGGSLYEFQDWAQCAHGHYCGRPDAGFGLVDLSYDVAGAVATELLTAAVRKLIR